MSSIVDRAYVLPRAVAAREGAVESKTRAWLRRYGIVTAVYILATALTNAMQQGDTENYVESITAYFNGVDYNFWEFGHLFWRPLGWIFTVVLMPVTSLFVGPHLIQNIWASLIALNWVTGLLCVLLMHMLVSPWCSRRTANVVTIAFTFTQTFLNYGQTGSAYFPAFALLLYAFHLAVNSAGDQSRRRAVLVGLCLAGATCLWVPMMMAIPAALLAPVVIGSEAPGRQTWRFVLTAALALTLFTGVAYGAVMMGIGLHRLEDIVAWVRGSAHGMDTRGLKRALIGVVRSFINMGNDGLLFKRFLIHDPFNPVALSDLIRLSLWKLALCYLFLGAVLLNLIASKSRRVMALFAINAIPVLSFALYFAGGEGERYLALYPLFFVSLAIALSTPRGSKAAKVIIVAFIATFVLTNTYVMAKPVLARQQAPNIERVRELIPRLHAPSRVFVPNWTDDLISLTRSNPFHPITTSGRFRVTALVTQGLTHNQYWREEFASIALGVWKDGGQIWVSRRVLSPRPRPEWNWAEGDDKRVSWPDFAAFFTRLEMAESLGGVDGFVRIAPSETNQGLLGPLTTQPVPH